MKDRAAHAMTDLGNETEAGVTAAISPTTVTTPTDRVLPTSEVVVAAHAGDAMYNVLCTAPSGDTNHVLCRGHDEPLSDFGRRVEWRLHALRRKSSIRKVCYVLGPHSAHEWLPCRQALIALIGLLSTGAEFELVAGPTWNADIVQVLDELMPYAEVGVRVSVRRDGRTSAEGCGPRQNVEREAAAARAAATSCALPGLVQTKAAAPSSFDGPSSSQTPSVWS